MSGGSARDTVVREAFLQRLRDSGYGITRDTVIARDNVYRVNESAHMMVRTSRFHASRSIYFFGLTRHIFEHFVQLPHPIIAFVLADTSEALLVPARWMWDRRNRFSADDKQFKLEVDKQLRLRTPKGAGKSLNLTEFREQFAILRTDASISPPQVAPKPVQAKHAALQGMLLEMGQVRGFDTFTPNRSSRFKNRKLGEIATVSSLPSYPGINNNIVRQIDVVWLDKSFPTHAFEIELTTGIWSGLVRLGELKRLATAFHVITDSDEGAFRRRIAGDIFSEIVDRCHHGSAGDVHRLYEEELRVADSGRSLRFRAQWMQATRV
jgi:hypothetical protein